MTTVTHCWTDLLTNIHRQRRLNRLHAKLSLPSHLDKRLLGRRRRRGERDVVEQEVLELLAYAGVLGRALGREVGGEAAAVAEKINNGEDIHGIAIEEAAALVVENELH